MSEYLSDHPEYTEFSSPDELEPKERELLEAAREAMSLAYTPYSLFTVGAAVRLKDGSIVKGANQENASYGLVICAERSTLFTANNLGYGDQVVAMAVMAKGETFETDTPVAPCGACRQVLYEFQYRSGTPITVLFSGSKGPISRCGSVDVLLPAAFGPANLQQ